MKGSDADGLKDRHLTPTMLRGMFALRFLETAGPPEALQRLLGLAENTPITRSLDACRALFPETRDLSKVRESMTLSVP
jgi:hypothetical protein